MLAFNGVAKTAITKALRDGKNAIGFVKYRYVQDIGHITNVSKGVFTIGGAFITGFTIGFDVGKIVRPSVLESNN